MIDQKLLEILVCPACQGKLALEEEKIVCILCQHKFLVDNGIPVLLTRESKKDLAES
ncbi:MAG: Trm112 family protein [Candidatus Aceula lacicola]|nr:Trm112 family protein [Candidatus Aceula lacicola]